MTKSLRPARRRELARWFHGTFSGELCAGLSAGPVRPRLVVPAQSGEGSVGGTAAHAGSGPCAAAFRLFQDLDPAPS